MQMPIPDDWDGISYCRWAVCWPESVLWQGILSGLLEMPSQGRFWDANTGSIVGVQQSFKPTYQANFDLTEVIMACGDTGLQDIAAAIRLLAQAQTDCCVSISGGGIQGTVPNGEDPPIAWPGDVPPIGLPEQGYPDGYESQAQYLVDKCAVANLLTDGLITVLTTLAAFDIANIVGLSALLAAGVGFGLVVISAAALPVILSALLILAAVEGLLLAVRQDIINNRDDWVCAMYEGETSQEVILAIAALLETLVISLEVTSVVGLMIKTFVIAILGPDSVNKLFEYQAGVGYPDADCTPCDFFECEVFWDFEAEQSVLGWAHQDLSTGTSSTSMTPEIEGLRHHLILASEANVTAWSRMVYAFDPGMTVLEGDTVTLNYIQAGTVFDTAWRVTLIFIDEQQSEVINQVVSATNGVLNGLLGAGFDGLELAEMWVDILTSTSGTAIGRTQDSSVVDLLLALQATVECQVV